MPKALGENRAAPLSIPVSLRSDCSRCAALCCIGLGFERSARFAFDKATGERCRYLDACSRCAVHDRREALGLSGCVSYDCLGAGQHMTDLLGGASAASARLSEPTTLEAFRVLRETHEQLSLLHEAARLPLSAEQRAQLDALADAFRVSWSLEGLLAFDVEAHEKKVRTFLRALGCEPKVRLALARLRPRCDVGSTAVFRSAVQSGTQRAPLPSSPTNATSSSHAISPSYRQALQSLLAAQGLAQKVTSPERTQADSPGQSAELSQASSPQ